MKEAGYRIKRLVGGVFSADRSAGLGHWLGVLVGGRPLPRALERGAGMRTVAGVTVQPLALLAQYGLDQESSPVELRLIARMLLQQGEVEAARLVYESLLKREPLNFRLKQEYARTLRALTPSDAGPVILSHIDPHGEIDADVAVADTQNAHLSGKPDVLHAPQESRSCLSFADGALYWKICSAALAPALARGGVVGASPVLLSRPEDVLTIRLVTSAWEGDEIRRQTVSSRGGLEGRWDVRPLLPSRGRLTAAVGVTVDQRFIAVRHLRPLRLP